MKTNHIIYSIIFSALFLLNACEKEIELDLRTAEPRLVIEGIVPLDSIAKVSLTMTKGFNTDNVYPAVEGATVIISDDTGNSEKLELKPSGWYEATSIIGTIGVTYNMAVELDGKTYTAVSAMPELVTIDSVKMEYYSVFKEAFPTVYFVDPAGTDNYYRYIFHVNGQRKGGFSVSSDEDRDGKEFGSILTFDSEDKDEKKIKKGDTIFVETQFIDKGAYTFFRDLAMIGMNQTNPASNITGDVLGYFSAYSMDYKTIIADWEE